MTYQGSPPVGAVCGWIRWAAFYAPGLPVSGYACECPIADRLSDVPLCDRHAELAVGYLSLCRRVREYDTRPKARVP